MKTLYIDEIRAVLPHRYPFLLVDRVVDISDDACRGTGIKNVTANEEFFQGHFPAEPVMPGVLIIEAMAQTAILVGSAGRAAGGRGQLVLLAGVDEARFKAKVVPGDQLKIKVEKIAERANFEKWRAEAYVDKRCLSPKTSGVVRCNSTLQVA
jgi:3-hydroxyacyl-[acyl-carrier-protein] dehydratase